MLVSKGKATATLTHTRNICSAGRVDECVKRKDIIHTGSTVFAGHTSIFWESDHNSPTRNVGMSSLRGPFVDGAKGKPNDKPLFGGSHQKRHTPILEESLEKNLHGA